MEGFVHPDFAPVTEKVQQLMAEKSVTGRAAWSRLFSEQTSAIRVDLPDLDEPAPLEVAMSRLQHPDREVRRSTGISDEQDFAAVAARETIESDKERLARNRAQYQVIRPDQVVAARWISAKADEIAAAMTAAWGA